MKREKNRMQKQGGFSLWELAIIVGLVVMGITAGIVLLRSGESTQRENERDKLLQAADFAITAFIAENGRLPCPATDLNGVENCSFTGEKGWLPYATLGLDASAPTRGKLQIKYLVYRDGTNDLTQLTNRFSPAGWAKYDTPVNEESLYDSTQTDPLNALDFCQNLTNSIVAGASTNHANIKTSSNSYNVAYALAEGGIDRDSDGNIFDGTINYNTSNPSFDSPTKSESYDYDDRVIAKTFLQVATHMSCPQGTRAMDVLAQAVETANEVADQKQDNADAALTATIVESVKALLSAADMAGGILAMAAGVAALSFASPLLATNVALCAAIITAPVGCPLAAVYGTAVGFAIAGIALAAVAIAANTAALVLQLVTAVKTGIVYQKATAALTTTTASTLPQMIEQLRVVWVDAKATAAADLATANADRTAANAALTVYQNSENTLFADAHSYDPQPNGGGDAPNDPKLRLALQNYKDYYTAFTISLDAEGNAKSLRQKADGYGDNVAKAKISSDRAAAISPSTPANILTTTQAVEVQAKLNETTAKAAADVNPSDINLFRIALAATADAQAATLDVESAKADPVNYVANKKKFYDEQKAIWEDLKIQATAAEANEAAKKTLANNALVTYNTSVDAASGYSLYNQNPVIGFSWGGLATCNLFYPDNPEYCYSLIKYRLWQSKNAYNDWIGKENQAVKSKKKSDDAAANEVQALATYVNLRDTPPGGTGSGEGIIVTSGAANILFDADTKGVVK
jgi:type II secretory pathway pseudopilin PulG